MYKKFLWFSALTACFITVFFAIFTLTKVNQHALENDSVESCMNLTTPPITDDSKENEPLHNEINPRVSSKICPKHDEKVQPKKDCETCPKQEGGKEESDKNKTARTCLKAAADDSTEDRLLIMPQLLEQRKHLPHLNARQMHMLDFLSPNFAKKSLDSNDTFDLKFKNAFTIEIIQNRDENGWHFYINGQEVQPNADGMNTTSPNNKMQNTPENRPMPLPEFGDRTPIMDNKNNMNNTNANNTNPNFTRPTPTQPNQTQPNFPNSNLNQSNQTQVNPRPIQPNQTQPNFPNSNMNQPNQTPMNPRPTQPSQINPDFPNINHIQPNNTVQSKPQKESSLLPTKTPYM